MRKKLPKDYKIKVRFIKNTDIPYIVQIHKEVLYEGIAAILGTAFLQVLYKRLLKRDLGLCIVAEKNKQVVGFCVGLVPGAVWKLGWIELINQNWNFIFNIIFLSLLKNPLLLIHFISGRKKQPDNIELYFLGVTPKEQRKGIGVHLINQFDKELINIKEKGYFLITWSGGKAEKFYFREGFTKLNEAAYLGNKISFMWKDLLKYDKLKP